MQRSRHYWGWTIAGYALTVLSVPLIGFTTAIVPALLLYGSERVGKAVRSPAKDTLLSHASTRTGPGSAFGVHQAMDQFGAMAGPLLLAGGAGNYQLAFGVLAVPGALTIGLLFWLRFRVPAPLDYEREPTSPHESGVGHAGTSGTDAGVFGRGRLPRLLWQYIATIGLLSVGVAPFPLMALHAQGSGILTAAQVPLLFAVAMAIDGLTGPVAGRAYDRVGPRVLLLVPVAAAIAAISFAARPALVWVGVAVWGVVNGILDSVVKAVITQLVDAEERAAAFGWLALARGAGLLVAGVALGVAYQRSSWAAAALIIVVNVVGLLVLSRVLRTFTNARRIRL